MLAYKTCQGLSLVAVLLAFSLPVSAEREQPLNYRAVDSFCAEIRKDIAHYYGLWQNGGTPKQMEVWQKIYTRNIHRYGSTRCPKYSSRMPKRLAAPSQAKTPAVTDRQATEPLVAQKSP